MLTKKLFKFAGVEASQKLPVTLDNSAGGVAKDFYTDFVGIQAYLGPAAGLYCVAQAVSGSGTLTFDLEGSAGDPVGTSPWSPAVDLVTGADLSMAISGVPTAGFRFYIAIGVAGTLLPLLFPLVRLRISVPAVAVVKLYPVLLYTADC